MSSGTTRVLTPDDLAERWSVPKSHVYRLSREGRIPTPKCGRCGQTFVPRRTDQQYCSNACRAYRERVAAAVLS